MTFGGSPLQITTTTQGTWTLLIVRGDLDLATAPELSAAVERAGRSDGKLALDLSEVRFIDSSGLRALLEIETAPAVVSPSPAVRDLLALTMMTDAFRTVDSLDELAASKSGE